MSYAGQHRVWVTRQCQTCGADEECAVPLIEVAEEGGADWEALWRLAHDEVGEAANALRADLLKAKADAEALYKAGGRPEFVAAQLEAARLALDEKIAKTLGLTDRF